MSAIRFVANFHQIYINLSVFKRHCFEVNSCKIKIIIAYNSLCLIEKGANPGYACFIQIIPPHPRPHARNPFLLFFPLMVLSSALCPFYLSIAFTRLSLSFPISLLKSYGFAPSYTVPLTKRLFPKKSTHCPLSK